MPTKVIAPNGTISMGYNSTGDMTSYTDALLRTTNYQYNSAGQVTNIQRPPVTVNGAPVNPVTYDPTILTYDPVQFILTSIKNSELDTMYFFLNTDGTVDTIRDYNGNDTKFLYYPNGNLKSVTLPAQPGDAGARTTTYNYDARSDYQDFVESVVDALSNTYSYVPDADLRVVESKDALTPRNSTFFRYVNPSDPTTRGLLDQITAPSNEGSEGNARKTNYFFDDFLRIVQVNQDIDVSDQATRLSHVYDGFSNLISQSRQQTVNGPNNTTTWSYDRLGRNITSFDPLGRLSRTDYAYYCLKNLVSTARGLQILTQMDSLCRVTQISSQREQRSFSYDEIGRVVRDSNSGRYAWNIDALTQVGSTYNEAVYENGRLYAYDSLDRVETITFPDGTTQRYEYDKVGNVTKVTDTQGQVTDYLYHPDNRIKSVTVGGNSFSYEYDLAGRLKKITYPLSTGIVLSITDPLGANGWDANSRLVWMRYIKGTNNLRSFNYSYDNSGNRTGLVDTVGTGPAITWSYTYDWLNRLLSATRNAVATSYSYDNCDNRLTTVGTTTKFDTYDFGDQLVQRVDGATTVFTYDRDGNMQSRTTGANTHTYLWSDFGNLQKSLLNGASQTSHFYDSSGIRRISGDGSKYYSSGSLVLTENRPAGPVSYIQGHQLLGIKQGGNFYYMIGDGLGSMLSMVDSTGSVVASNETDAYGVTLGSPTGSIELRANTFTGALGVRQEGNSQTIYGSSDIYYARARYYDASLGRWLSPDPIGFAGGLNLYAYVGNNPVNGVDPSGLLTGWGNVAQGGARIVFGGIVSAFDGPFPGGDIVGAPIAAQGARQLSLGLSQLFLASSLGGAAATSPFVSTMPETMWESELNYSQGRGPCPDSGAPKRPKPAKFYYHYTGLDRVPSIYRDGLYSNSSVTDKYYKQRKAASQFLGIPLPDVGIPIRDKGQFIPNSPAKVESSYRFIGGGTDFTNPLPVPPGDLSPLWELE